MFYAPAAALRRVGGYVATTRAEAIRRAQRHGRKAAAARTFPAALTRIRASCEHLRRWQDGEFPRPGLREPYRQTQPGIADYPPGEPRDLLLPPAPVPLP